jgi:hypothetical protein
MGAEEFAGYGYGPLLEVMKAFTMILTMPSSATDRVDTVAVVTGQGEQWRLTSAIQRWQADAGLRHLLVANGNPAEQTYAEITLDYLRGLGLRRVDGVVVQAEPAPNTWSQAAWIVGQVQRYGIRGLALVVSPYHLPRAYLTVLKAFLASGVRLPIVPVPAAVPPDTPVPETGATAYDLVPGEVKRILTYMEEGWVATPEELRHYLHWLWSQQLDHCSGSPMVTP